MEVRRCLRQCMERCSRALAAPRDGVRVFRRRCQFLDDSRVDTGPFRVLLAGHLALIRDIAELLRPLRTPRRPLELRRLDGLPGARDLRSARVQKILPIDDVLVHSIFLPRPDVILASTAATKRDTKGPRSYSYSDFLNANHSFPISV